MDLLTGEIRWLKGEGWRHWLWRYRDEEGQLRVLPLEHHAELSGPRPS
jgi:hypothetical protein